MHQMHPASQAWDAGCAPGKMHIHLLDPYRRQPSPVHALDSRAKFVLTVAFVLTAALLPIGAWAAYLLLLALILSVEVMSLLGVGHVLKRASLALPFVVAALPLLFTIEGRPLFTLGIGGWSLTASVEGLERLVSVALKSWLSIQAAVVLAATTQFPELLRAMRAVGMPRLIMAIFGLMWRYLFLLADEALRLMRARSARSGQAEPRRRPGGTLAWRARVTGGMAGSLFLRAYERSDRIYAAMLARGYDGEVRLLATPSLPRRDRLVLLGGLGVLTLLLALGYML